MKSLHIQKQDCSLVLSLICYFSIYQEAWIVVFFKPGEVFNHVNMPTYIQIWFSPSREGPYDSPEQVLPEGLAISR